MDFWVCVTSEKEQKTYFLSLTYVAEFPKWAFLVVIQKQLERHIIHLIHELLERHR